MFILIQSQAASMASSESEAAICKHVFGKEFYRAGALHQTLKKILLSSVSRKKNLITSLL
jgi:hypothetical protein